MYHLVVLIEYDGINILPFNNDETCLYCLGASGLTETGLTSGSHLLIIRPAVSSVNGVRCSSNIDLQVPFAVIDNTMICIINFSTIILAQYFVRY